MSDEDARTVWVGNLDPGYVTEEVLYELFLQAGPLQFVRQAKDRTTGEKKTFAFVCYRSESAVPYAIRLFDGLRLFGRPLKAKNRELEEHQRKQGRNGQQMGEGIHTLCPAETQNQQSVDHRSRQAHKGRSNMDPMQQQMNMVITAAGLMGNNPHLGGGSMMPSHGYQQSHMNPSPNRNNKNNGRNYGGGSSRYLDNESMKNVKKQFDSSSNNFDFNRLGGPVGNGNDYNRGRQNDSSGRNIQDALGGPVGYGNDYSRGRQNDSYGGNMNDYRNNGKSPDGRREHHRDNQRGNSNRHDNRYDNNRVNASMNADFLFRNIPPPPPPQVLSSGEVATNVSPQVVAVPYIPLSSIPLPSGNPPHGENFINIAVTHLPKAFASTSLHYAASLQLEKPAGKASLKENQVEKQMRFKSSDFQFVTDRDFQKDFRIVDRVNGLGQVNEENSVINTNKRGNNEEKSDDSQVEKKIKKSKKRKQNRNRSEEKIKDFKWKDTIYKLVKAVPDDGIRINKLKKKVIAKYLASSVNRKHETKEKVKVLFTNKLKKCKKCVVVGERVWLSDIN